MSSTGYMHPAADLAHQAHSLELAPRHRENTSPSENELKYEILNERYQVTYFHFKFMYGYISSNSAGPRQICAQWGGQVTAVNRSQQ